MFEENKFKSNPGVSELQGGGERRKTHFSRWKMEDFTKSKTQPCLQLLYNNHGLRCTPSPPVTTTTKSNSMGNTDVTQEVKIFSELRMSLL